MNTWKRWLTAFEIMLAVAAIIVLFLILNIASAGLLLHLVAGVVCFVVLLAIHYLVWGRAYTWTPVVRHQRQANRINGSPPAFDEFAVGMNDAERNELLRVLEHSLAETTADPQKMALRREMVEKLRMFGA